MLKASATAAATLSLALVLMASATAQTIRPGDILVVDPNVIGDLCTGACGVIIKIDPVSGAQTVISSGAGPRRIAIAQNGDILVTDSAAFGGSGGVSRVNPDTGAWTIVSSGGFFVDPSGIALEADGHILVADPGANAIIRVDPVTGVQTIVSSGGDFLFPTGVATDADGDIIVSDENAFGSPPFDIQAKAGGAIFRVNPVTGAQALISSGVEFFDPVDLTVDASGEIFVGDFNSFVGGSGGTGGGAGAIFRIDPSTGAKTVISTGGLFKAKGPFGLALEANGQIVVTAIGGAIIRVDPATGAQSSVSSNGWLIHPGGIAVVPATLTVASSNPNSGVSITATPNDKNGVGFGNTPFALTYNNTSVTLTAPSIAGGNNFSSWTGCDNPSANICTMTMNADKTVTAVYVTPTGPFTLRINKPGSGSGKVTSKPKGINCGTACQKSFSKSTNVALTAKAARGSKFAGWSDGCSGAGTCAVVMNADTSVTATFNTLQKFALNVKMEGTGTGTVTSRPKGINCGSVCSASLLEGTAVTLTAKAAKGSVFAGWNGGCSGTGQCKVTMNGNVSVTATFNNPLIPPTFTLTVAKQGTGSGTVTSIPAGINCGTDCAETYNSGAVVTLAATPDGQSTFAGWSGDADCSDGVVTMNGAKNCTATFTSLVIETTSQLVSAANGGTLTLPSGSSVTIPGGILATNQIATLSLLSSLPQQPPSGLLTSVGPILSLSLTPSQPSAGLTQSSAARLQSVVTASSGFEFQINLSNSTASGLEGSAPVVQTVLPQLPSFDSMGIFAGTPGQVGLANNKATFTVSPEMASQFHVNSSNSTVTLNGALFNWNPQLPSPPPDRFGGRMWDKALNKWVTFDGTKLDKSVKTCVLVHGMFSSVEKAFPDGKTCVTDIGAANGCAQIVGFNYPWWQPILTSGMDLAKFLQASGLQNVILEAHSEGGPVTLAALSQPEAKGLNIAKLVTLGSPLTGTPAADRGDHIVSLLANFPRGAPGSIEFSLAFGTLQFFLGQSFVPDLTTNNAVLANVRAGATANHPEMEVLPIAGTGGSLLDFADPLVTTAEILLIISNPLTPAWEVALLQQGLDVTKALLNVLIFGSQQQDSIVNGASALGENSNLKIKPGTAKTFPLAHTGLECDPSVIKYVGSVVNPLTVTIAATDSVATEAGPTTGTFTVTRTGSTATPLAVLYTVSGSAAAGSDYNALSGSVTIPTGSATATITVTPINDTAVESDQTVVATLAANAAYTVGSPGSATVVIVSDDCSFSISPTSQSFSSSGGTGSVSVTATTGCNWKAVSKNSFITRTSASTGSGNGTVNYSVAANTSTGSRTGTMTIAGRTFTVTQAGAGGPTGREDVLFDSNETQDPPGCFTGSLEITVTDTNPGATVSASSSWGTTASATANSSGTATLSLALVRHCPCLPGSFTVSVGGTQIFSDANDCY